MSEVNTKVFAENQKFVDLTGLQYFWGKTKGYVDAADLKLSGLIKTNETAIEGILAELNTLSGGVGSVGTQIQNAIDALKLPETYDAKGAADTALADAKTYVDGKVDGKFDAVGSADAALVDAKAYTDEEIGKLSFDAAGTAETLVTNHAALDTHITAQERIDWNAAKSAIDAFMLDATVGQDAVDTLKELQTYMENDGAAAAQLVDRVADLEAINHDAYIAADETVLANAKSYVDGKVDGKFDETGAAAKALADAKSYADGKFQVAGNYENAGAAAQALTDAKSYADGLNNAMDTRVKAVEAFDHSVYAKAADVYAKGEVDSAVAQALADAKADAATKLASYYTKTEVDNLLTTNSSGDRAYAKSYTDQLFDSMQFAQNSEIDALFA